MIETHRGETWVRCDRCGFLVDSPPPDGGMTAGYYHISKDGEGWGKFTNPGERHVCDACMWSDPRYIAVYGRQMPSRTTQQVSEELDLQPAFPLKERIPMSENTKAVEPDRCPTCGERPTHAMPLKRVRNGITYTEVWCANAHCWLVPESQPDV